MLTERVLYIDAHLIVLDKPAGLAVHPGPATPDSLEDHLDDLRFGFQRRPQPAHRLDRDTSGCLVLGRHPKALKRLAALFAGNEVRKTYWAVVEGGPPAGEGVIDAPLAKISSREQGWRVVVDRRGKPARTCYRVLGRQPQRSWVEFTPETGRTHQIRVHAALLGCPILGDPVYGHAEGGMLLHARRIIIPYKDGADPIIVTAAPPPAIRATGFAFEA